MTLTHAQFDRTRQLALRLCGIELFDRHRDVLARRCRRLGIHEAPVFDALLDAAAGGDAGAGQRLIGLLTTNFSGFFRHARHFEIAAEHALWAVHRRGRARLWSAAAATGEEPYSLAMSVLDVFRRDDPPAAIIATDIDDDALAIARRGAYGAAALSALPNGYRARFFEGARLADSVRRLVDFSVVNLTDLEWPLTGAFDVVLCRNVLMYLDASHRYAVLERMASLLAPDGVLFLDPAEHLGRAGHLFAGGADGVYRAKGRHP